MAVLVSYPMEFPRGNEHVKFILHGDPMWFHGNSMETPCDSLKYPWNPMESPWNPMESPWNSMETLWDSMESPWSLNHKTGIYLQGESMEYFTRNPMGSHGEFRMFISQRKSHWVWKLDRYSAWSPILHVPISGALKLRDLTLMYWAIKDWRTTDGFYHLQAEQQKAT